MSVEIGHHVKVLGVVRMIRAAAALAAALTGTLLTAAAGAAEPAAGPSPPAAPAFFTVSIGRIHNIQADSFEFQRGDLKRVRVQLAGADCSKMPERIRGMAQTITRNLIQAEPVWVFPVGRPKGSTDQVWAHVWTRKGWLAEVLIRADYAMRRGDLDPASLDPPDPAGTANQGPPPVAPAFAAASCKPVDGETYNVVRGGVTVRVQLFDVTCADSGTSAVTVGAAETCIAGGPVWVFPCDPQQRGAATRARIWTAGGWVSAALLARGLAQRHADPYKAPVQTAAVGPAPTPGTGPSPTQPARRIPKELIWPSASIPADKLQDIGRRMCLVRVDGALGLPVSYASGFLLGGGKMVVTDLASVAQPGVKQVMVILGDGTEVVAKEFGMADPALGIAAIKVDLPEGVGTGLALAKADVIEEGISAAVIGWRWGEDLNLTAGMLKGRVPAAEVADKVALETPPPNVEFLRFLCPRLDVATGAAVVDEQGTVVGIMVRLMGTDKPIGVPGPLIRQALLAAGTDLKPLEALPNALWPVSLQVRPGRPPTAADFAAAVRLIKIQSLCSKCRGKGIVTVKKFVGMHLGRKIFREEHETCDQCAGEGILCGDGLYSKFSAMAEGAAHLIAAPDTPKNVRDAAFANGMGLLVALGKVPEGYRNSLTSQIQADLDAADSTYPRGAILYAQVKQSVKILGDDFTVLAPYNSQSVLMVNSDLLTPEYSADDSPTAAKPDFGAWLVVGGVLEGTADVYGAHPVFMRPFGWSHGPQLGTQFGGRLAAGDPVKELMTAIAAATRTPRSIPSAAVAPIERTRPKPPPRARPDQGWVSFFGL